MTGGSIVGLTGAIVGNMLTPDKALSTLPIAVQQAGVMAATIPAALLMVRIGRRPGFWLGTAIGGVGAVIATWAIFRSSFEWFCVGTFLLGANRGATQQYRFAAAEIADEAFRSKAISLVLAGGVVSRGVRRRSRQMVARPVRAGAVRRLLCLDPRAVSRVGCPAVFRRAAAAGDTGVGRRWPAVARDRHGARRSSRRRWRG